MKRAALVLALASCAFSQKHPSIAAAITGAVVGGLACEIDNPAKQAYCGIIAGGAAVFLGGVTALVTLFADTSDHELTPIFDHDDDEDGRPRVHTSTPPPPVPVDAGVELDAAPLAADAS